jgi:DNA-binding transcriptional LysR family regulator
VELRDIEIFLTLAEELHFGRTAARLHVSQARVSQAIKKQERRIGGALFERTSRNVKLTPLGAQLRDDLRGGYDAIQTGIARAANDAHGTSGTLRVGVMGVVGYLIGDVLDRFRGYNADSEIVMPEIHFSDPFGPLRRDEADIVVLWRPIREPDLTEGPVVFTEGRVLAVWAGHELASRSSASMEDLAHSHIGPLGSIPAYWVEAMIPVRTPSGRTIPRCGPNPSTFHELLNLVAARQCVTPLNEHVTLYYSGHPGVVFVPIHDAPTTEWALVWRTANETPLVRALAQAVQDVDPPTLQDLTAAAEVEPDLVTDEVSASGRGAA